MAGRVTSAFHFLAVVCHLILLIDRNNGQRFGDPANNLFVSDDRELSAFRKPLVIDSEESLADNEETSFHRSRRDVDAASRNNPNITTKINALNDSHQQLMVHWVGEGSNVIICLARDSTPILGLQRSKFSVQTNPSAVYISYDYGDTFVNKTHLFKVSDDPNAGYAILDKFYNHQKYNSHWVFVDSTNSLLFFTTDHGENITRVSVPFHPSEISLYEYDYKILVALDKNDSQRKLWLSTDWGKNWQVLYPYVKAFFWSPSRNSLLLELTKPTDSSNIIKLSIKNLSMSQNKSHSFVITNVEDFQIRDDYMFATRRTNRNNSSSLELLISYRDQGFVTAQFDTELDRKDYHIADVSNDRVFVAVSHNDTTVNLYVSEVINGQTAKFGLSLEGIFTFFPNSTWKHSWLNEVADEAFTDLYRVEGLRGIYIASQVKGTPKSGSIGPEHLISRITYDHGATWNDIQPPETDHQGASIHCTKDCSLHLTQRFSQLYPVTRSVTIMSSKSAPGIILATGVVGYNLKGHPALYVSRDAGLTWKQVLKDYNFFNMGDHGGLLVAVKYFKSRGETKDLSFSTDEGETWQSYVFHEHMLRVYGLMTEPGENTTVFTIFGSGSGQHKWLIIKVDLRNIFERNCTDDDFKPWSPMSMEQPSVSCILGRRETYLRRAQHTNCYIGRNYDVPVSHETCPCDFKDYTCDFGFVRSNSPSHCIRNKSLPGFDPYAIPAVCPPGQFYNRTKGYIKIPDDECTGGLEQVFEPAEIPCPMEPVADFLLVARREHISQIDLLEEKIIDLPVHGLKNVIAIEYDLKNNCLYWADIVNDTIGRQCLRSGTSAPEILVETELNSVEGMAYDWVSKVLYFVDGVKMRIQIIRTDLSSMGRMRRTILGPNNLQKPRGIAVHPVRGYMYWTDWAPNNASVSRANLDGTNIKRLFVRPMVEWPNGITIDYIAERIYWVDAREDYIGSADLDGKRFKKIITRDEKVSHPFAVAVFKDNMYWDDWKQLMIFEADKDHGVGKTNLVGQLPWLMDLKVYAHSIQTGTNACANTSLCSHICLGSPNPPGYTCLCPDGMEMVDQKCMCPGGVVPFANSTCPRVTNTCSANQFSCHNGVCIPATWKCDGDNDCGDSSDEADCSKSTCGPNNFECDNHKCIPKQWVCDVEHDCKGGEDEVGCKYTNCTDNQFRCDNGHCIPRKWQCDKEKDCQDGSDEKNCAKPNPPQPGNCESDEFFCESESSCIPLSWKCDGQLNCKDGTDEIDCTSVVCEFWQFFCNTSSKPSDRRCINKEWVCDGENDCVDGQDELNCTKTKMVPMPTPYTPIIPTNECNSYMIMCNNSKCIPYWWRCDGFDDCGDTSDEQNCSRDLETTRSPEPTEQMHVCGPYEFQCKHHQCISVSWVCDGTKDCSEGEDELHCGDAPLGCREDQFMCLHDGSCVPLMNICNGVEDCPDRSDEQGCHDNYQPSPATPSCHVGFFPCDVTHCIPMSSYCDGQPDCSDGFDERDCDKYSSRAYQVVLLGVDERFIHATSFSLFWVPLSMNVTFEYLPSVAEVPTTSTQLITGTTPSSVAPKWRNATEWIKGSKYQFVDLRPYTNYNVTLYMRVKGQSTVFPSGKYITVRTGFGVPSPPWDVTIKQKNGTQIEVSWRPPKQPNGPITGYDGFITPPNPPLNFSWQKTSAIIDIAFQADKNYTFWVKAKNRDHVSESSEPVTLMFDGSANIDYIRDLRVTKITNNSVELTWAAIKNADGYHVTARPPPSYPALRTWTTLKNTFEVTELAPGVRYIFEVNAMKKTYVGKVAIITATTQGTPLPFILNLEVRLVKHQGTTAKLSWDPPKSTRKIEWTYAVYYALNMQELYKDYKLLTPNLTATVKELEACESYVFAVGVRGEYGAGPLSQPVRVITHYNKRAAPKNLRVTMSDKSDTIVVSWNAYCFAMDEPVGYTISVTEMVLNKTGTITLPPTNETVMKHTLSTIKYGGKYRIVISSDVEDAIPSKPVFYIAPPILPPYRLNAIFKKDEYILNWQEHDLPENMKKNVKYHYEILVNEGERTVNETTAKIFKVDQPPYIYENAKTAKIYSFAVRLVTDEGYRSILSEVFSVTNPRETAWPETMNTSNVLSLLIPICLLIVALGSALAYFVVRHRRLSNSFTQFANSHYDTKRGEATFPGTTDGLEEDEGPIIRGFSDDEPLVIA